MFEFEKYQTEIDKICKKYEVKSLIAFGSSVVNEFNENSDIDFLLELKTAKDGINRYMNIKFEMEDLFKRSVDLVMPKAIKDPRMKEYIFSNTREIYAA